MEIQQELNLKICLIGYGYWGKIIHKNLISLGYSDIKIIDIVLDNFNELTDDYNMYFVVTPFTTHYEILTKLSKFKNKKIWCEKPLIDSYEDASNIYHLMERNGNMLFVDWVYTFNPCVDKIRKIVSKKMIKQVILNRTNDGPARFDTDSIHDLSSHDLSILYHIFGRSNFDFTWNEFSVKSNEDSGSNISWYYKNGLQVIINSSWQHKTKNRVSLFITEDDEIIVFDDVKKTIVTSKGLEDFSEHPSPLQIAINHFIFSSEFEINKELTLKITKNLEHAI
jgi:predicted dehydrogenase